MPRSKKEEKVETPASDTEDPESKKTKKRKKDKKDKKKKTKKSQDVQDNNPVEEEDSDSKKSKKSNNPKSKQDTDEPDVKEEVSEDLSENGDTVDNQFCETQEKTDELLKNLILTVQERIASDKDLLVSLRELNRQVARERKDVSKVVKKLTKSQRKKRRGGNKSPGGFTKPAPLSEHMCAFLEVPEGTELPRTEVTRRVNKYVKDNDLQNPENKKQILADGKLKSLLFLKDNDELTYFNLQRFMKVHFLKKDPDTGLVSAFSEPITSE